VAPRVVPLLRIIMSAIGAEPDMSHYLALVEAGAISRCKSGPGKA